MMMRDAATSDMAYMAEGWRAWRGDEAGGGPEGRGLGDSGRKPARGDMPQLSLCVLCASPLRVSLRLLCGQHGVLGAHATRGDRGAEPRPAPSSVGPASRARWLLAAGRWRALRRAPAHHPAA